MAEANDHESVVSVKTCEVCGSEYRKNGRSPLQWQKSRACSHQCVRVLGAKSRTASDVAERFWPKVDKTPGYGPDGDCWEWVANRLPYGYGTFNLRRRIQKAHRVSYELSFEAVPADVNVLHRCDNPACVRPDHLFLGTHKENMADMVSKDRANAPKGEHHHDARLTEDQVRSIRLDMRPNTVIAKELGVTKGAIWLIKARRNWRHVE